MIPKDLIKTVLNYALLTMVKDRLFPITIYRHKNPNEIPRTYIHKIYHQDNYIWVIKTAKD